MKLQAGDAGVDVNAGCERLVWELAVRGEEAEGASQHAPPHLLDPGYGIADCGLEEPGRYCSRF
jgi:hypothetical protein